MKIIYVNCGERCEYESDLRSNEHYLSIYIVKINGFALNTSSMLKFQLQKHNKSCIGITWRDLIMEAEVFD